MIGGGLAESLAVHVDSGVVSHYDAEKFLAIGLEAIRHHLKLNPAATNHA
jgi:hypothetical protein